MKHFVFPSVIDGVRTKYLFCAALLQWLALFTSGAADLREIHFKVDDLDRTALVYIPSGAATNTSPLVFVFHGHGGNSRQAARSFHLEKEWPEAIVIYPQGVKTPGQLTDPEGNRNGWQAAAGDEGDRDLKFFDAMLARLKQDYRVNSRQIYATGHSNGGGFTYLLWLMRGDVFAAVAPSAAVAKYVWQLKPKPVMHLAGESDPLVKFAWQKRMMEELGRVNGCVKKGKVWGKDCTLYTSPNGTPVVTFIHTGGHEFAPAAPALIAKFFREYQKAKS